MTLAMMEDDLKSMEDDIEVMEDVLEVMEEDQKLMEVDLWCSITNDPLRWPGTDGRQFFNDGR